jgi:NAD(P)-dependent dehydrogenase (short-subunit alcohol dehydrogenase family)
MTSSDQSSSIVLVTGASRGFGRAIASALHVQGALMVAVARNAELLDSLNAEPGGSLTTAVTDVTDPVVAATLIEQYRPDTLVLNAGAQPLSRPLHRHTRETCSRNWEVDGRHAFHWMRESLLLPLAPTSTVVISSWAAVAGSPLSGGYAGSKATIRFITGYAAEESERAGLGIRFVSVLPRLTSAATDLGSGAVAAYAQRDGISVEEYRERVGPTLKVDDVGQAAVHLVVSPPLHAGAYLLTAPGLSLLT